MYTEIPLDRIFNDDPELPTRTMTPQQHAEMERKRDAENKRKAELEHIKAVNEINKNLVCQLYIEGWPQTKIAQKLSTTVYIVKNVLKKRGYVK